MRIIIYNIFYIFSFLIRNFILPNPFERLQGQTIGIDGIEFSLNPVVINFLIGPILIGFTSFVVGFYYKRVERKPLKGSILYLFFYLIHAGLISVIVKFNFSALSITLVIIIYLLLHILIYIIRRKIGKLLCGLSY